MQINPISPIPPKLSGNFPAHETFHIRVADIDTFVRSRGEQSPQHISCPLSGRLMTEPVLTAAGQVYEQRSIAAWFTASNVDPSTYLRLSDKRLIPSPRTRRLCHQFKQAVLQRYPDATDLFTGDQKQDISPGRSAEKHHNSTTMSGPDLN